jgi:predicted dehydrogenase
MPTTSRRDFIATAMLAPILPTKLGANERVNLGFIGVGTMGTGHVWRALPLPDVNVVAAIDLYDGRLTHIKEVTEGRIETGKEYRALLDRKDIDAVVIATPDHWHKKMTIDALEAGKDVYCEKPLTWSIDEGPEIIAAVKRTKRLLQVGAQGKTAESTLKAREIIASGRLGKIHLVRMGWYRNTADGAWHAPIPPDASPRTVDWDQFLGSGPKIPWSPERFFRWRCWWEYSGGLATDLFVHVLTEVNEIMRTTLPTSVSAHGGTFYWKDGRNTPDVLQAVFEYSGFLFQVSGNLVGSLGFARGEFTDGVTFIGSDATLVVDGPEGPLVLYTEPPERLRQVPRYSINSWPQKLQDEYYERMRISEADRTAARAPERAQAERIGVPDDPSRGTRHLALFVKSVKDRSPSVESAEDGHHAAAAAHLANIAYRKRQTVRLDPATGKVVSA